MHVPLTEVILSHDGTELARATLPPGEYVIGREVGVDLHANTPLLSRRHARLTINYDHLLLEDLGSSNGTFVNERPLTAPIRLFPNQTIRFGPDLTLAVRRLRAPTEPGVLLAPVQAAIARHLPAELLAERRYAIGGVVAQGGMGAILDARQTAIDRTVAMKVMLESADEAAVLRFIDEAKITGQLDHPNIVPIYELGVDEQGQVFYTMKFVRGTTLKDVLAQLAAGDAASVAKYPLTVLLTVFQKVCDALAFAHSKQVIHRDLKPENLMLGDFGVVLVMDWGLAKVLGKKEASANEFARSLVMSARRAEPEFGSTMAGTIMGTPAYMSPEQARGENEILDARSDIYALGAILFEILHLRPAYTGGRPMQIVDKVGRGEVEWVAHAPSRVVSGALAGERAQPASAGPAEPTAVGRGRPAQPARARALPMPASLLAVVRKALALDADKRYPRVEDLQADLLAYQNGFATSAEKAGAWKQFTLLVKRHKAAAIGVAAVLVLSVGFTAKVITEGRRAERALTDLRKAAPALAAQAQSLVEARQLDEAIEKLGFALAIDRDNADYQLRRAHLLQAAVRLPEASAAYRRVLALRPADTAAQTNLALCLKLAATGQPPADSALRELYDSLRAQGRSLEGVVLGQRLGFGSKAASDAIHAAVAEWKKLPGWSKGPDNKARAGVRITSLTDGTFGLSLDGLPIQDLTPLRKLEGLPISELNISNTLVSDLSPIHNLPLRSLDAARCPLTDLTPLRGMKILNLIVRETKITSLESLGGSSLQTLDAGKTGVSDLSPLKGLPLETLLLSETRISDLSPLEDLPLKTLNIDKSRVSDLRPLHKMPLQTLSCWELSDLQTLTGIEALPLRELYFESCRRLQDISAVKGMSLNSVSLRTLDSLKDYSPLTECKEIKRLVVGGYDPWLGAIRSSNIQRIDFGYTEWFTAAKFWANWDVHQLTQNANRESVSRVQDTLARAGWIEPRVVIRPDGTLEVGVGKSKLVTDLSPLKGLNLSSLNADNQPLSDLTPLSGLPLRKLFFRSTKVADLSPLRGMPLEELYFGGTQVSDLSPLLEMPNLRSVIIPRAAKNIEALRPLTKLAWLGWEGEWEGDSDTGHPRLTPAEFWQRFDAEKAAGKK